MLVPATAPLSTGRETTSTAVSSSSRFVTSLLTFPRLRFAGGALSALSACVESAEEETEVRRERDTRDEEREEIERGPGRRDVDGAGNGSTACGWVIFKSVAGALLFGDMSDSSSD